MVRRIRLTFWSVLGRLHDRLHEMMDRRNLEFWTAHYDEPFLDTTVADYDDRINDRIKPSDTGDTL
jgi:hypothetical protein